MIRFIISNIITSKFDFLNRKEIQLPSIPWTQTNTMRVRIITREQAAYNLINVRIWTWSYRTNSAKLFNYAPSLLWIESNKFTLDGQFLTHTSII